MALYQTLDAIVGPTTLRMSDVGNPYRLIFMQGIGIAPVNRTSERAPFQDGVTDTGYVLDPRTLGFGWLVNAETMVLLDGYLDTLAQTLRPLESTPVKWRVTRTDGEVRQIDSYLIGELDYPNTVQDRVGASQIVGGRFYCPDPVWYDPTLNNVVFDNEIGSLVIPLTIPLTLTASGAISNVQTLAYGGTYRAYPTIYITGPATDVVITNESTGDVLDFTGTTIAAGATYIVTLGTRPKTIVDSNGVNRIGTLVETTSNLATWHLKAQQAGFDGNNDIRVDVASGATGATQVSINYYDRYINL